MPTLCEVPEQTQSSHEMAGVVLKYYIYNIHIIFKGRVVLSMESDILKKESVL